MFANGGYRINPFLIARITDSKGRVLNEPSCPSPTSRHATLDARNAFVMTACCRKSPARARRRVAQAVKLQRGDYSKTGTTNDSNDAWFAGWQQQVAAVVWMGYDTPRKLGDRETGGGLSLPIWIDYTSSTLRGVPVAEATLRPGA